MSFAGGGMGELLALIVLGLYVAGAMGPGMPPPGSRLRRGLLLLHALFVFLALEALFGAALAEGGRLHVTLGFVNWLLYPLLAVALITTFPPVPSRMLRVILIPLLYVGFLVATRPRESWGVEALLDALGGQGAAMPYLVGPCLGFALVFWRQSGRSLAAVGRRLAREPESRGVIVCVGIFAVQTVAALTLVVPTLEEGLGTWVAGVALGSVHIAVQMGRWSPPPGAVHEESPERAEQVGKGMAGGLVGLILFGMGLYFYTSHAAMQEWPQVEGRVLSSRVVADRNQDGDRIFVAEVSYRYQVDGEAFRGDRIRRHGRSVASQRSQAARIAGSFPVGETVTVYYDPQDPELAVLDRSGVPILQWALMGSGGLVLLGTLGWLILGGRQEGEDDAQGEPQRAAAGQRLPASTGEPPC